MAGSTVLASERFGSAVRAMERMAARSDRVGQTNITLSGTAYLCEKATAGRSRGLAYRMEETSARKPVGFPPHVKTVTNVGDVLDYYFMACSLQTTVPCAGGDGGRSSPTAGRTRSRTTLCYSTTP